MKSYSAQWLCMTALFVSTCLLVACGSSGPHVSPTQNALVAEYSVPTSQGGDLTVEFGTDTSYGRQTASYPVVPGLSSVLVAGMKPSTTYHMRAQLSSAGGVVWSDQDRVFTTGSIPAPVPAMTVTRTPDPALQLSENPGVELVTFYPATGTTAIRALVTDREGNPIWYCNLPGVEFFKPMPNGHMLISASLGQDSLIRETDLAGKTIRDLSTAVLQQALQNQGYNLNLLNFSHDFIPMKNGHLIVLLQIGRDFTDLPGYPGATTVLGDALVDLDQDWNPVWVWSAFDYLDVNRQGFGFPDWTHSNAIIFNPNDGNLLLSMRNQSWILDIDYQNGSGSGNVLWRLGEDGDFTLAGGNPAQWFYAQHFPSFVNIIGPQMTLAVFDDGDFRILDNLGTNCGPSPFPICYSRATVFQLDQNTKQAQLLWQYLPGFYTFWGGAINQLQNGNVEFEMSQPFGSIQASLAMEVTQAADPQIVWQMELSGGTSYRTYRIPSLYPNVTWP